MIKKFCVVILVCFVTNFLAFAVENKTTKETVSPPVWSDYVPEKYENPRHFTRGKSIAELSVGIFLTDLIITCPIGIPMIVHSTTKLKNQGYYEKKVKFEKGLQEAEKIKDPEEKQKYYDKLIKDCKLSTERRDKKLAKQQKKAEKKKNKEKKKIEKENKDIPES